MYYLIDFGNNMFENKFNKDNYENDKIKALGYKDFLDFKENYDTNELNKSLITEFLTYSSKPQFITNLSELERLEWVDFVFQTIRKYEFNVLDMFKIRHAENPNKALFKDMSQKPNSVYTYDKINYYTKEIAAAILKLSGKEPIVGLFLENSIHGASVDLACLFYGILDSPLNVNFKEKELLQIIERIDINVIVTDDTIRYELLDKIRTKYDLKFQMFVTNKDVRIKGSDAHLNSYIRKMNSTEIDSLLGNKKPKKVNEVATIMFTSGSTGTPKGLCFSNYNLVSKRFARGAAVPFLGENDSMLCYLPLFHTFGRYLEMLGCIYWNATYHFVGNTSTDSLMRLFPEVNPSIFISIPLRWKQLAERAEKNMEASNNKDERNAKYREIVGSNLKWGLSAAGYLDPKIFMFHRNNDVKLCSGFGMTEATGGITMTPPDEYYPDSVGKPLPGVELKLAARDELLIKGHYIAKYLGDVESDGIIPYPEDDPEWLPTGDVFKIDKNRHYTIVDRIKDIYKNNRGQTVAPKNVENRFVGVPGIKSTYLVGDGKPYNTLLIVSDKSDEVYKDSDSVRIFEYFSRIISEANKNLAPYEKVINYKLLNREFSQENGELTAKGSFNRKTILQNFSEEIKELYKKPINIYEIDGIKVRIPKWIFINLSILESEIKCEGNYLINTRTGNVLFIKVDTIKYDTEYYHIQIGDLVYISKNPEIDLGIFAKLPTLWLGNPELIRFLPYRVTWDQYVNKIETHALLPQNPKVIESTEGLELSKNSELNSINILLCTSLYHADKEIALKAINKLDKMLLSENENVKNVIRKRLEALSNHNEEDIRCAAYRILLLDEPSPDYSETFPAFLMSGKTFLNSNSIEQIATGKLEKRRLEALRKRLYSYRQQLDFPINKNMRQQFGRVFELLYNFIRVKPEYYTSVRYELITWILLKEDKELSKIAEKYFDKLSSFYEFNLDSSLKSDFNSIWNRKLVFDDSITNIEVARLKSTLVGTSFLKQSIMLAFEESDFSIENVKDSGLWITRLDSGLGCNRYRLSITTNDNDHFELQVYLNEDNNKENIESIYHHVSIAGYPFGSKVLPRLGAYRPELKAKSLVYISELTVWDKVKEFSSKRVLGKPFTSDFELQRIIIEAISTYLKAWQYADKKIVPGYINPNNVVVPELDFREGGTIISIEGWKPYQKVDNLFEPILRNFYLKLVSHYKWLEFHIHFDWFFDSFMESFGYEEALGLLNELKNSEILAKNPDVMSSLDNYLNEINSSSYKPLALFKAINRYKKWVGINPQANTKAKEDTMFEVSRLYKLNEYSELIRYIFYRDTFFENYGIDVKEKFNRLINKLSSNSDLHAEQLVELSDLQATLPEDEDREVFSRMVFPDLPQKTKLDVEVNEISEEEKVYIKSYIKDRYSEIYTLREPKNPSEIGHLYRLFFVEKYPKTITDQDKYFVVVDDTEKIVGGLCYREIDDKSVLLDGSVIVKSLKGRGLGSALLQDFSLRMAAHGIEVIKAHFFMQDFYLKRGFEVNEKWGVLVKFLKPNITQNIKGNYCQIV